MNRLPRGLERGRQPRWLDRVPRWAQIIGLGVAGTLLLAFLMILPPVFMASLPYQVRLWVEVWGLWSLQLIIGAVVVWRLAGRSEIQPAPRPGWRDVPIALCCSAVGVFLFTIPDLYWVYRTGRFTWVCDYDEVLYLAVGSQAYFNHPLRLADPAYATGGIPLYYWLPCVPGILLAKGLGLGPMGIGFAWRLLAGATLPLGWYVLLRRYVGPPVVTAALVILLTADVGAMFGRPVLGQLDLSQQLLGGTYDWLRMRFRPAGTQWRTITPGVIFIALGSYLALLNRAREAPTRVRTLAAGLAYGLLFYVYFYYWTAAGLALVLGVLLDRGHRWTHFHVGWIGALTGAPAVLSGMQAGRASSEALMRFNLFMPGSRWEISFLPTETIVLAGCLVWIWVRRRDLFPIGALALSGWLLINQQVVTGLRLQNDHWRLHTVGPVLTMAIVLIAVGFFQGLRRRVRLLALGVLFVVSVVDLGAGVGIRLIEAQYAAAARRRITAEQRYVEQRSSPGAFRLVANAVVGGDADFVDWAMILDNQRMLFTDFPIRHSLTIGHAEWNTRLALNNYLLGMDPRTFSFVETGRIKTDFFGPWVRDPAWRLRLLREREKAYEQVAADPKAALDRFRVRYVGLPARKAPPRRQACGWRLVEPGRFWWIWERPVPADHQSTTEPSSTS